MRTLVEHRGVTAVQPDTAPLDPAQIQVPAPRKPVTDPGFAGYRQGSGRIPSGQVGR